MGLWTLLEGCLLLANALAILNEDRFLAPRGWSFQEYSGIKRNSFKGQILGLIYATHFVWFFQEDVSLEIIRTICLKQEHLGFPRYTFEVEGPQEAPRFKSKVCVEGKSYESLHFFPTLKDAEQAAAKFACQTLSVDATQEGNGLYKNLLQEFVQKRGEM